MTIESGEKTKQGQIRLVAPIQGEVTPPLQLHTWTNQVVGQADHEDLSDLWYSLDGDRSQPRPVRFTWEQPIGGGNSLTYNLIVSPERSLRETTQGAHVLRNLIDPHAEIYNLCIGMRYYWKVTAHRSGKLLFESGVGEFMTHPAPPRWIRVPGITNVRDIGGWPLPGGRRIRQGMIFRGSEMNNHCQISPEGQNVLVEQLSIRTDLDLRGVGEDRMPVLDLSRVEYTNIPVLAYDSIAHPEFTGRYRAMFTLLANRACYPFFIHCWGGADRTGTVVFLIQALLGMCEEDLFTDYELTSLSIWGERLRTSDAFQDLLKTLELFGAHGSSIQTQVERYLKVIGVTEGEISKIKEILVE